jgi:hypothetical protein
MATSSLEHGEDIKLKQNTRARTFVDLERGYAGISFYIDGYPAGAEIHVCATADQLDLLSEEFARVSARLHALENEAVDGHGHPYVVVPV